MSPRRRPLRRTRHLAALALIHLARIVAVVLPRPVLWLAAGAAGRLAALLPVRANRVIAKNRRIAAAGARVRPWQVYRSVLAGILDFLHLSARSDEAFLKAVRATGAEHLERAASRGRGVICVTAHYGAWELIPRRVVLLGHPTGVVGRRLFDRRVDEVLNTLRRKPGITVLDRGAGARSLVEVLRAGTAVGILIDQDTPAVESGFFDFMGVQAMTPTGPARLAVRLGVPVVPLHIRRRRDGTHEVIIGPEIEASGADALTLALNGEIARWVEDDPSQWIWFHDRWSRRPPGGALLRQEQAGLV